MAQSRVLRLFLKKLNESKIPSMDYISEDDINFLTALGRYMVEKRKDPQEALKGLNYSIKTAGRRSELYSELRKYSQDRLKDVAELYTHADTSYYNEEDYASLLDQPCSHMGQIMSGSTDGNLLNSNEGECCIGKYEIDPKNVQLFTPTVNQWLEEYMKSEPKITMETIATLQSVQEVLRDGVSIQETFVSHDPANVGTITYARR